MSYAALNYGSSTTDGKSRIYISLVKLRQFIFGYVGTIPNEAAYIYMATVVGNIAEAANGTDSFGIYYILYIIYYILYIIYIIYYMKYI